MENKYNVRIMRTEIRNIKNVEYGQIKAVLEKLQKELKEIESSTDMSESYT